MRILIDECIDERLRHEFSAHDCQTARYARLAGLRNGDLLIAAETAGFEVIITVDQNIPFQQDLSGRTIAVLILCTQTNRLSDLRKIVPDVLVALGSIQPGQVMRVPLP